MVLQGKMVGMSTILSVAYESTIRLDGCPALYAHGAVPLGNCTYLHQLHLLAPKQVHPDVAAVAALLLTVDHAYRLTMYNW